MPIGLVCTATTGSVTSHYGESYDQEGRRRSQFRLLSVLPSPCRLLACLRSPSLLTFYVHLLADRGSSQWRRSMADLMPMTLISAPDAFTEAGIVWICLRVSTVVATAAIAKPGLSCSFKYLVGATFTGFGLRSTALRANGRMLCV